MTTIAMSVEQQIADDILSGRLAPGAKLDEQTLAARFEVSRTPVREALRQLLGTGLVESIPRRGAVVTSFGPERLSQLYEAIGELETLCARLAAQRMTAIERKELEPEYVVGGQFECFGQKCPKDAAVGDDDDGLGWIVAAESVDCSAGPGAQVLVAFAAGEAQRCRASHPFVP